MKTKAILTASIKFTDLIIPLSNIDKENLYDFFCELSKIGITNTCFSELEEDIIEIKVENNPNVIEQQWNQLLDLINEKSNKFTIINK